MVNEKMDNGFLIKKMCESLERKVNNSLQSLDLTCAQAHVLIVLDHLAGNMCSLKELEKYFHVAQSTIAGTVARLEKKKLVEGVADASDRRIKMVRLTELGKARCLAARNDMLRTEQLIVSNMTTEEAQEFGRLLRIAYDTIR